MRSWRSSVCMNAVPKHAQTNTCMSPYWCAMDSCCSFFSWHLQSFVKYLNFSNDLTRVSCVWGNSKATTASFSWGSSCAIDLSACHMRTRRRRKERGWTHFYTRETISWLYFAQDAKIYSQALRHYWINMIYVWILVYLVSCELQARQRSWASHCCQSSNQGRERDVDETSCNIKPETLPQKDSFPNKKDQKGIRWNKDPLFGKLKASEQQGTKGSWRIGKEARTFPTVFTLEHLVPCSVAPTFDNLLIPKWLSLHGQLWNLFLISTSKLCPAFETRWLGFASLTTKMDSS